MPSEVVSLATDAFRAVVNRIIAADRQPTAWEAGCLFAALCELANGREENALRKIPRASARHRSWIRRSQSSQCLRLAN